MTTGKALEIARTYVQAIGNKDVKTILSISTDAVVAELIKVRGSKLASTDVIYDAAPFAAYMATVQSH